MGLLRSVYCLFRVLTCRLVPHGRWVRDMGVWRYRECRHCGWRQATKQPGTGGLIGPRDEHWPAGDLIWYDQKPIVLPRGYSSNYARHTGTPPWTTTAP
ncbi:MAG: hypothetical protein K2V38_09995 [Gemmataceae bacterium]|nr:hypothetical protein [Gemmataceae bacterium]